MKIKELKRTVNVSWSPAEHYPVCLAAGSAAQQVDASFSSNSILELYSLNLEDPGLDLEVKASLQTQHKFHKLAWSGANVLVGGCDGGLLEFYSTEKLLNKSPDALLGSTTKHNGQVSSLDVNPYQKNLLASAAAESEIFIWDLNNTSQPMAPGNRSQPFEQVQGLAWNQQVQHILGSTFSTRCVVWDLRKNEPIMKLSDSQTRTRWRALSWHPSVATQLCIASEDDQVPVLQLWDLRLAASPLVTLEGHHKGVMAMSWSSRDPDLLLSGGKDGRVLCWNPNNTKPGGELLSQLSQQPQWVVDLAWCPRVPSVLLTTGETLAVHSLEGGSRPDTNTHNQNSILDSFGGDAFSQLPAVSRAPTQPSVTQAQQLPTAPKWYRRATRAKFAFGGKLVSFEKSAQEAGSQKAVYISQVISEPDIVEGAASLDHVLALTARTEPAAADQLAEYCRAKGDASTDQSERYTWFFLRANFLPNFRSEVLNLLGFKQDEIPGKFKPNGVSGEYGELFDNHVEALTKGVAGLSRGESTETDAELSTDTSTDLSDAHTLIERKLSNVDAIPAVKNVTIPNGEDSTSLICRALICGNLEEAVELCLDARKVTDAFIIASLGSQELLSKVQKFYLNSTSSDPISLLSSTLLLSRWDSLVTNSASGSWRQTLAAIITHCEGDVLPRYCEMLGDKLSQEKDPALIEASTICYLCSMSVDSLVRRWQQERKSRDSAAELTALVEKALLAKRAKGHESALATQLETLLEEYGHRLASQGCLQSALHSLQSLDNSRLKQRLMCALRQVGAPRASQAPTLQSRARTVSSHTHAYNDVTNNHHSTPAFDPNSVWQQGSVPAPAPPNFAPARPPSAGPQPGGITSRSKYKVDPSVQSAPLYNQYNFQNPITSQPSAPQPYGGYNSPIQDQYNVTSVPGHNFAPVNTVPLNPVNPANTAVNGSYYNAPQVAQEAQVASKPAAPGWNDPPMMTSKPKPKQEMPAQAPITHPLFGVEPPQHIPLAPVGQYPGQQAQYPGQQAQYPGQQAQYPGQQAQYPGQQAQYPGQQAQYPGQQSYPGQQGYPTTMSPGYTQQKVEEPAPVEKVPVQKAPIPEEHAVLQSVFDALRSECSGRASNAQIKRKLEDVQKRLETLYDLLREYRLSESALSSLHTCASLSSSGDFASALGAASSLATGADFASVASFLPGLKVLLQLATQLQAHAR